MSAACFMRRVHLYALVTCWQTLSRVTFHVSHSGLSSQQGMLLPGQRNVLLRRCFMPNGWHCWPYAPNDPQRFRRFWRFHHETTNLHKPTISEKESKKRIFCILYIFFIMSLARSSYLYLQHVATQKKLNGVQSYSQLHPNAQNKLHES